MLTINNQTFPDPFKPEFNITSMLNPKTDKKAIFTVNFPKALYPLMSYHPYHRVISMKKYKSTLDSGSPPGTYHILVETSCDNQ